MKAIVKKIMWLALGIVLILLLGVSALILFLNPNNYKSQIATEVSSATGRALTINGNIAWTLWPNIGFKIGNATLSNPVGFNEPIFAQIDSAKVSVKLLPLLFKHVEINTLTITGLKLSLIQKSPLLNNWTFNNETLSEHKTHKQANTNVADIDMHISRLNIDNATVQFIDEVKHQSYQVQQFTFKGRNLGFTETFPISMAFKWQSNSPRAEGEVNLTADAALSLSLGQYELDNLKLNSSTLLANSNSAKPIALNANLTGKLKIDLPKQTLAFSADSSLNKLLSLNVQLQVKALLSHLQYTGEILAQAKSLTEVLLSLNIQPPQLPNKQALNNFALNAQFNGDENHIIFPNVSVAFWQSNLQGNIEFKQLSKPELAVDLNLNKINVADYINLYGALLPINGIHLEANLNAASWNKPLFTQTLNGKVFTSVQQATLQGIDITAMLRGVNAAINKVFSTGDVPAALNILERQLPVFNGKQNSINPHNGKKTEFTAFSSNSLIVNGLLTNTLALTGQDFHMQGGGSVDFSHNTTIDYKLTAGLLQDSAKSLANNINVQVPFKITGTPQNLEYGVDMRPIEEQLTEMFVKKIQGAAENGLQNAAGAASNLLQNLISK